MYGEIIVAGSDKKLCEWVRPVLSKAPFRLRFRQIPRRIVRAETVSDPPLIFFQSGTKAVILLENEAELPAWTRIVLQEEKGPVLWAVSRLSEDILGLVDNVDVKGILTPDTDPVAAGCLLKMAIASWQKEAKYRKMAYKALTDLENRKQIEKAKGILMDRFGLSESEAYQRIRRESMNRRKSMAQIAESILLAEGLTYMS